MRVDGVRGKGLSFDNMHDRAIKGTLDWSRHAIVLDVPEDSTSISFGVLLKGTGQVWVDDFEFEVVKTDVPTTDLRRTEMGAYGTRPRNLQFEE
jgi:hypothetical protein